MNIKKSFYIQIAERNIHYITPRKKINKKENTHTNTKTSTKICQAVPKPKPENRIPISKSNFPPTRNNTVGEIFIFNFVHYATAPGNLRIDYGRYINFVYAGNCFRNEVLEKKIRSLATLVSKANT